MERWTNGEKNWVKEKEVIGKDEGATEETVEKRIVWKGVTVNGKD